MEMSMPYVIQRSNVPFPYKLYKACAVTWNDVTIIWGGIKGGPKLTPEENINLPKALLSRFDLIFLLLDKQDKERDELLANHVGAVHRNLVAPGREVPNHQTIDADVMRAFIAMA